MAARAAAAISLDHVGLVVHDLDAGARVWQRLGFRLSTRSPQMGLDRTGERFEPWATANHCGVLERGYLELIGVHRPDRFNPWQSFLDRFEGAHIGAFRCADAERTYAAIRSRSGDFHPPVARRRDAPYGEGTREMRFRNIFSRDDRVGEGRYIVIEHQTPEVLWQPALMIHPNGARSLESLTYVSRRPRDIASRIDAITGGSGAAQRSPAAAPGPQGIALPGGGSVEILSPARFENRFPGSRTPPLPSIGAFSIGVADLDRTRAWLRAHDVPYQPSDRGIWVAGEHANGCATEFTDLQYRRVGP